MDRRAILNILIVYAIMPTLPVAAARPTLATRSRSVMADVPGLDQRVTYSETKIPLGELVAKVAEATGVPLTAAKDVADEPVAVVVKEFPAGELLEQLAELLDYRWRRRGQSERVRERESERTDNSQGAVPKAQGLTPKAQGPTYEIWQDLAAKQREEALRNAVHEDVERRFQEEMAAYRVLATKSQTEIRRLLAAEMPRQREIEKLPPAERQALGQTVEEKTRRQHLQRLREMWSPTSRALALLMNRLSPGQWETLRAGWWLNFSSTPDRDELPLTDDVLRTFRSAPPTLWGAVAEIAPPDPVSLESRRRDELEMQEHWRAADGFRVFVRFSPNYTRPGLSLFTALATPLLGGRTLDVGRATPFFPVNVRPEDSLSPDPPDPEREARLAQDPLLGVRKPFPPAAILRGEPTSLPSLRRYRTLPDLLPDIARAYGVNVIADSYWTATRADKLPQSTETMALFSLLDRLTGTESTWDRRGGDNSAPGGSPALIRIRDRNWFLNRPSEIPLRTVHRWVALCDQFGALPLEEYASLASSLSEAQLDFLWGLRAKLVFPPSLDDLRHVRDAREYLQFFATLLPEQRRALRAGKVLSLSQLPVNARPALMKLLSRFALRQQARNNREPLAQNSLSLTAQPEIRTRQERDGVVTFRTEPVRVAAGQTAPRAPTTGAQKATAAAKIRQYPVQRIKLQVRYGEETVVGAELVVASEAGRP